MRMWEIIGKYKGMSKKRLRKNLAAREVEAKELLPLMYGVNSRAKEQLELEKLRAEIEEIKAKAALHRTEADEE